MLTDKDILNMPLRELLEIDSEDNSFAEISIKAIAKKFVALEEEDRRNRELASAFLNIFGM